MSKKRPRGVIADDAPNPRKSKQHKKAVDETYATRSITNHKVAVVDKHARSLAQLKALDSVGDSSSQLQIASSLCNHAHRADMILRWLLPNLDIRAYQFDPATWHLLAKCVQNMQPQSIASRLKNANLLEMMTEALEGLYMGASIDVLYAIHEAIQTLANVTASDKSATSGWLLKAPAVSAAKFFERWTDIINRPPVETIEPLAPLVATAIQIWSLRQPADEATHDTLFIDHCWLPASEALVAVRGKAIIQSHKQYNASATRTKHQADLEQLIIRHVFSSSRMAFLKAQSQDFEALHPDALLNKQITTLGEKVRLRQKLLDEGDVKRLTLICPTLLDIAVRCGSIRTHRQALKEMAWYDAVFNALVTQLESLFDYRTVHSTILEMLDVMQARPTLSLDTLQALAKRHALKDPSAATSWDMLYSIVKLNPRTFCNLSLFSGLASAVSDRDPAAVSISSVKTKLIIPIRNAFARDRRLLEFIQLWQQQINEEDQGQDPDAEVWFHMGDLLENALEEHLTSQQIVAAVKERCDRLEDLLPHAENQSWQVAGLCVVLAAMIRGISKPETQHELMPALRLIYDAMVRLGKLSANPIVLGFWPLALQLLELILPSVCDRKTHDANEMLSGSMMAQAIKTIRSTQSPSSKLPAALYIGQLCRACLSIEESQAACRKYMRTLYDSSPWLTTITLIVHPSLFKLLETETFPGILSSSISEDQEKVDDESRVDLLQALYEAAFSTSDGSDFLRSLAAYVRKIVEQRPVDSDQLGHQVQCLDFLIRHPELQVIKTETLEELLQDNSSGHDGAISTRRHVLLQRVLSLKQSLRRVSMSTAGILDFCDNVTPDDHELMTIEAITTRAIRSWCVGEDQKAAAKRISELTEKICRKVKFASDESEPRNALGHLRALRSIFTAVSDIKQSRLNSVYNVAAQDLLQLIQSAQQTINEHDHDAVPRTIRVSSSSSSSKAADVTNFLSSLLDAALALVTHTPRQFLEAKHLTNLQSIAAAILTKMTPRESDGLEPIDISSYRQPAICAYSIMCAAGNADVMLLAHAAARLLEAPFSSIEHELVQRAYAQPLRACSNGQREQIVSSLLTRAEPISASNLSIARLTLEGMDKQDTTRHTHTDSLVGTLICVAQSAPEASNTHHGKASLSFLDHVLRQEPQLANQYLVEETLGSVCTLARSSKIQVLLFPAMCSVVTALLKHHRARLSDRFHILVPVFQALLRLLLAPASHAGANHGQLSAQHAALYARLLALLCDPPQQRHNRRQDETTGLIDQARRLRAQVGSFVPALLHSYCSLILRSPPRSEIREALRPGIATVLQAMEIYDADSIKVLSSAMTDSERSVLRSLVEEWRAGGRWSGK